MDPWKMHSFQVEYGLKLAFSLDKVVIFGFSFGFSGVGKEKILLTWAQRVQIAKDMAAGLQNLHQHNVIHRDFKASNILLADVRPFPSNLNKKNCLSNFCNRCTIPFIFEELTFVFSCLFFFV